MRPILASELDDIFDDDDIVELDNNIEEYESKKLYYLTYIPGENEYYYYHYYIHIEREPINAYNNTLISFIWDDDHKIIKLSEYLYNELKEYSKITGRKRDKFFINIESLDGTLLFKTILDFERLKISEINSLYVDNKEYIYTLEGIDTVILKKYLEINDGKKIIFSYN